MAGKIFSFYLKQDLIQRLVAFNECTFFIVNMCLCFLSVSRETGLLFIFLEELKE